MSSSPRPGATQFLCRATLENQRGVPGKPKSFIYDTIVYATRVIGKTQEVLCSLRYFAPDIHDVPPNGIYDIVTQVRSTTDA
jgi:hypothetical protein